MLGVIVFLILPLGLGTAERPRQLGVDLQVYRMEKSIARFVFTRESPRLMLHLEAINPSTQPCELELRLNGTRVGRVRYDPTADAQSVDVPLSPPEGRSELSLVAVGGAVPPLVLTSLQIFDP